MNSRSSRGTGRAGCGGARTYDFDFSHPVARQYRLTARYRRLQDTGTLTAVGSGGIVEPIPTLPPKVIINEFRTRGPNGSTDQFVEVYNDSLTASVGILQLFGGPGLGFTTSTSWVQTPSVTIGPLCHYLFAAPGYRGSVRPDFSMPALLVDDGKVQLDPYSDAF